MKSLSSKLLICFLMFVHAQCFSQNSQKIDSLNLALERAPWDSTRVEILVNLWRATAYSDPQTSVTYANKIIDVSQKIDWPTGLATGFQRLGISYSYMGENDSALYYYHKALAIYQQMKSDRLQAVMLYNIGISFQEAGAYDSAIHYTERAGALFGDSGDQRGVGAMHEGLGAIEQERGNYHLALKNFLEAAKTYVQVGDSSRLADAHTAIGDSYYLMDDYRSALNYYTKSIDYHHKNHDLRGETYALIQMGATYQKMGEHGTARITLAKSIDQGEQLASPSFIADATANLGLSYLEQQDYNKALPLFERSLSEAKAGNYTLHIASNLINIGWIRFHQELFDDAEKLAVEGLELAEKSSIKESIRAALELLSRLSEKKGEYQQALAFYTRYKEMGDSLYSIKKSARIAELQTLYETEKKENEIALQREKIKVLHQQARIDKLRKTLLGIGLIGALFIGGLVVYSSRQKIRREKAEREQERSDFEKELAFKKRELTTHTLHLVQKNELLSDLKEKLAVLRKTEPANKKEINRLIQLIKSDNQSDKDWEHFKMYFEQVHEDFDTKLRERINDLTNSEMRLASLMKMNLSTKEIAIILNISPDSVNKARYRLRKKLNLSGDDSLHDFILAL